jgi:hypothetical protein
LLELLTVALFIPTLPERVNKDGRRVIVALAGAARNYRLGSRTCLKCAGCAAGPARCFLVNFNGPRGGNIAARANRSYVIKVPPRLNLGLSMPPQSSAAASLSRPLLGLVLFAALLVAAALGLWAHYGTAVFFEMVRTGWVSCF